MGQVSGPNRKEVLALYRRPPDVRGSHTGLFLAHPARGSPRRPPLPTPRPVSRTRGQKGKQTPRASKLATYLPRMRYTINGGVFGRLPGKWGDGARGPRGRGRRAWAEEAPAAGQGRGCRGFPPVTCGAVSTRPPTPRAASPSGAGAQDHVWFCFSEGEWLPGRMVIFFSSTRRENEIVWKTSEGRARGRRRRGRHPSRTSVSGYGRKRLGARGTARERLWEQRRLRDGGRGAAGLLHRPTAHSAVGPGPPRSIAPRYWPGPA